MATRKQVEHILLVTGEDGKLQLHGSSNLTLAVVNDDHLHASLTEMVSNSRQVEGPILTASHNTMIYTSHWCLVNLTGNSGNELIRLGK